MMQGDIVMRGLALGTGISSILLKLLRICGISRKLAPNVYNLTDRELLLWTFRFILLFIVHVVKFIQRVLVILLVDQASSLVLLHLTYRF